MEKKIKLREMTEEQYKTWTKNHCDIEYCNKCPFKKIYCISINEISWIKNKDLYSDKFLDQEIEIEVELLTPKEKEYLENLLKPFKEVTDYIIKTRDKCIDKEFISIKLCNGEYIYLPYFNFNEYYKNMKVDKKYILEDLGLFEEKKYKITLTEFWNSKDNLAIHCDTEEKANKFIEKSNKTDKWGNFKNYYKVYEEKTCYCNDYQYGDLEYFIENNYTIYEFDEVDLEN